MWRAAGLESSTLLALTPTLTRTRTRTRTRTGTRTRTRTRTRTLILTLALTLGTLRGAGGALKQTCGAGVGAAASHLPRVGGWDGCRGDATRRCWVGRLARRARIRRHMSACECRLEVRTACAMLRQRPAWRRHDCPGSLLSTSAGNEWYLQYILRCLSRYMEYSDTARSIYMEASLFRVCFLLT